MTSDALLVEARGAIRTIVLNRPDQRNALPPAEWLRLADVLAEIGADPGARVIVFRGAGGRAFSAGYDINALRELDEQGIVLSTPRDPFEVALAAVVEHPLPIVAMVNGFAVGGGCTLAAGCDIRLAAASARFGMPPAKLGLVYSPTELRPFAQLLGVGRTKLLFFSGRIIPAQRAYELGLVDEVLPDDELEAATYALAEEIAANAPLSLEGNKRVLRELTEARSRLDSEIERGLVELRESCFFSEDFREGIRSFAEKRPPRWQGR